MEINANEDIIKIMIRSGVPDVPLPTEVELLIMVDTNKRGNQPQGSKAMKTQSQTPAETEEVEPESDKAKNRGNPTKGKGTEPEEEDDDAINCKNRGRSANKGQKDSDKLSNCKKPSAETLDLFTLPDFDDDDQDDEDYEPLVKSRRKRKAVPLVDDDEQDNGDSDEEQDNGDDDDEDYEQNDEDEEEEENNDEEDDKEITLQKGKTEEWRRKIKAKSGDIEVIAAEMPRGMGQWCANVEQATEFRGYIKSIMKAFEENVKKGKLIK